MDTLQQIRQRVLLNRVSMHLDVAMKYLSEYHKSSERDDNIASDISSQLYLALKEIEKRVDKNTLSKV